MRMLELALKGRQAPTGLIVGGPVRARAGAVVTAFGHAGAPLVRARLVAADEDDRPAKPAEAEPRVLGLAAELAAEVARLARLPIAPRPAQQHGEDDGPAGEGADA